MSRESAGKVESFWMWKEGEDLGVHDRDQPSENHLLNLQELTSFKKYEDLVSLNESQKSNS